MKGKSFFAHALVDLNPLSLFIFLSFLSLSLALFLFLFLSLFPSRPGDHIHLIHVIPRLQLAAVFGAPPVDFLPQQVRNLERRAVFFFFFSFLFLSFPSTVPAGLSRPLPTTPPYSTGKKKKTPGPRRLRAAHQERRALRLPALPPAPPRDPPRPRRAPGQGRGRRRLDRQRRLPQGLGPGRRRAGDGLAHKVQAAGVFPGERDELLLPPLRVPRAGGQVRCATVWEKKKNRGVRKKRSETWLLLSFPLPPSRSPHCSLLSLWRFVPFLFKRINSVVLQAFIVRFSRCCSCPAFLLRAAS